MNYVISLNAFEEDITVTNIVNININTDTNTISFFDSLEATTLPVLIIPADNFAYIKKID